MTDTHHEVIDLQALTMALNLTAVPRDTAQAMLDRLRAEDSERPEPVYDETCDITGFVPDYDRVHARSA